MRYVIATLLVLVVISVFHRKPSVSGTSFTGSHVRVLICAGKDFPRLSSGYVYDLVRRFSSDARFTAEIAFVRDSSWVDSLRSGAADLVAIDGTHHPDDSLQLAVSVPLPGHYVLAVPASDIARMQEAAQYITGMHDYRSFCGNAKMKKSTVRVVDVIRIEQSGNYIRFYFHGNGFLQNMVRIMTGTLLEVGYGKRDPEEMAEIIEAKDRKRAGFTAPAQGLCLMKVDY